MNTRSLFALSSFFPGGILQQMCVNFVSRQLDISEEDEVTNDATDDENLPDNTATNETVLDTEHVRIFIRICHTDVCQFNIQVLVNLANIYSDNNLDIIIITGNLPSGECHK